uniref:penicillin acylase family protein n=1 Tax=uncultured Sphingomonas sp. TaxID=158754 RepID=UPI0025D371F2
TNATITRDRWGIAHVSGRTDADAVFGMIYAQAEDDFPRIEANYLAALGRTAEAEGEKAIWADLRARMVNRPETLQRRFAESPAWLRRLMVAWAAGLNRYLATHPQVRPRVLTRYEPWMALSFTEGSIGGDIEAVDLKALEAFYSQRHAELVSASMPLPAKAPQVGGWTLKQVQGDGTPDTEPRGSNGIAIAPRLTRDGRALLLINPHTSFYFRSEQQVTSGEGLNAYGAATWGQFFIYQGFNDRLGWMHTTSTADVVDEFAVTPVKCGAGLCYRHGQQLRPFEQVPVSVSARGVLRRFTVWRTHHGPVVRSEGGKWIAVAMMHRPVEALQQGFLRTKARSLAEYMAAMRFQANSSNNTLLASREGTIAMLYPQFVPQRSAAFDRRKPADGSDPAADWQGVHALSELPNVVNPRSGWALNTNNWPYSAAGAGSLNPAAYPSYMDAVGENPRGLHALQLLQGSRAWTPERLRSAAYDPRLTAFDLLLPPLFASYDRADATTRARLREPVALLRRWDRRWSTASEATTLAVHWGEALPGNPRQWTAFAAFAQDPANGPALLSALDRAVARLTGDHGRWRVPWGEINRFQRVSPSIAPQFDDRRPSLPVGFTSGIWGSLASFGTVTPPGSVKRYGNSGNSFVAVVEFGPRVRAMALSAGGQSGDPASPHFRDQAPLYPEGRLRPVPFHPDEVKRAAVRRYRVSTSTPADAGAQRPE